MTSAQYQDITSELRDATGPVWIVALLDRAANEIDRLRAQEKELDETRVAHLQLDRAQVPRADAVGERFSLWGRIEEHAHQQVQAHVTPEKLSHDEWTSREP